MNALTLLKADHKTAKTLFDQFEKLGENAKSEKKKVVERIIKELSIHAAIEEQLLYPAARKAVPDTEDNVLEALEEHHIVKWTLSELDKMSPEDERFDAKVSVLIESVRHHIKEEEGELFPKLQSALDRKELEALGASLEAAKKAAPTHPHPRAPDTPPGNLIAGPGAAVLDRVVDTVVEAGKAIAKKVRGATKTTGKQGKTVAKRATSAAKSAVNSASKGAKSVAKSVAKTAENAADSAAKTAKSAAKSVKSATKSVTKDAKSAAKGAVKSVKSVAKGGKTASGHSNGATKHSNGATKHGNGAAKRGKKGAARVSRSSSDHP